MSVPTGDEPILAGPYALFDGSFTIEFLKPSPQHHASVIMKSTYSHAHPFNQMQKACPQTPPFHLHFNQSESFRVLKGRVGTTLDWSATDKIWTPAETGPEGVEIVPWRPHTFWPTAEKGDGPEQDTVLLVWAHPDDVKDEMDAAFFRNLLFYISDVAAGKESMSLLQIMLMQQKSASTVVMLPSAWWLGPLRWWIPYMFQAGASKLAELLGYSPILEKYTDPGDYKRFLAGQRRKID